MMMGAGMETRCYTYRCTRPAAYIITSKDASGRANDVAKCERHARHYGAAGKRPLPPSGE